jgi:Rrf2 family protein
MKISRATIYSILAAIQLSEGAGSPPIPCSQLAKLGNMPERFLLQVLRNLVNHGLLQSTRGVEGGYRLAKPLSEITILEMIEATDGPVAAEVPDVEGLSPQSRHRLAATLEQIADDSRRHLEELTLAQLKPVSSNQGHFTSLNGTKHGSAAAGT